MPFERISQFFFVPLLFVILNPLLWSESGENERNSNKEDKDFEGDDIEVGKFRNFYIFLGLSILIF